MPCKVLIASDESGNALLTPFITSITEPPKAPWAGCRAYGGRSPGETIEAFHARQPELQGELIAHIGQTIWNRFLSSALQVESGEAFGMNIGLCVLFAFDLDAPPAYLGIEPTDNPAIAVTKASQWALGLPTPIIE
jgi:hypothetical protein